MWILWSLLFLYLRFFQITLAQVSTKIIGGTTTTIDQHTYMVSIYVDGSFKCGGSLHKTNFVITAAHCVNGISSARIRVCSGKTFLNGNDGVCSGVSRIILPTQFNSNSMQMDIAVLKLTTPSTATPIELYTAAVPAGETVTAIGWGLTSESGYVSNQLRRVDITVVSTASCQNAYRGQAALTSTMMCASQQGKDSCNGDSGGPLIYRQRLVGVVSWGIGCARPQYPGVYTTMASCRTFINAALKL